MEKDLKTQNIEDGFGAKYHRIYQVKIRTSIDNARKALSDLKIDPNNCTPQVLATFEKTEGTSRELRVGDEFQIHITGPWNGPVRVVHTSPDSFTLETLEGHLEAGHIIFRLKEISPRETLFEIESIARSRDRLVDFFYDKVPIAKAAQTQMWMSFCKRFAEHTSGEICSEDDVHVKTERYSEDSQTWVVVS